MSIVSQYGPVWKNEFLQGNRIYQFKFESSTKFPSVDSGPLFEEEYGAGVAANGVPLRVKKSKRYEERFPIISEPCFWPLVKDCSNFIINSSNKRGNSLSSYQLNDTNHLVYVRPTSSTESVLQVSKISQPNGKEAKNLALHHRRVLREIHNFDGLDCCAIKSNPSILVQYNGQVSFLSLADDSFSCQNISHLKPAYSCLNRRIESNFAVTSNDGKIKIFDAEVNGCCWGGKLDELKNCIGMEYGAEHPMFLNIANNTGVCQFDGRLSYNSSHFIFSIDKMKKFLESDEVIQTFKSALNYPFTYISCTNSLLLMDNRYCKHPILIWQHMMKGQQAFPHILKRERDVLLVAQPDDAKLCLVATDWAVDDGNECPQVKAISTPKHLNLFKNTLEKCRQRGIFFTDQILQHLQTPIVGLTHCDNDIDSNVFLQNESGNIFNFSLFERNSMCDKRISTKQLEELESLEKKVVNVKGLVNTNFKLIKVDCGKINLYENQTSHDVKQIATDERFQMPICPFISEENAQRNDAHFFTPNEQFSDAVKKTLNSSSCPFSRKLLSVWEESEENEKNGVLPRTEAAEENSLTSFAYKRLPFIIEEKIKVANYEKTQMDKFYPEETQAKKLTEENATPNKTKVPNETQVMDIENAMLAEIDVGNWIDDFPSTELSQELGSTSLSTANAPDTIGSSLSSHSEMAMHDSQTSKNKGRKRKRISNGF